MVLDYGDDYEKKNDLLNVAPGIAGILGQSAAPSGFGPPTLDKMAPPPMDFGPPTMNKMAPESKEEDDPGEVPEFDAAKFKEQQKDAQDKKDLFGVLGMVASGFQNAPTFGQLHYGQKASGPDIAGALNNYAKNMSDPTEQQMALYKAAAQSQAAKKAGTDASISEMQESAMADSEDPDSAPAKAFRASLKSTYPQLAAAMGEDFDKITPAMKDSIWDPIKLKATIDEKRLENENKLINSRSLADDRKSKADSKVSGDQDKAYADLRSKLESFRGNQGAQQASRDILSSKKTLLMIENKDPNTLSVQDLHLLAGEIAKIATGGIPTESGVEALMPKSSQMVFSKLTSFLQNKPTDAQAGEFIKHNLSYLKEMQGAAEGTINQYRSNIAKGYKNRIRKEDMDEAAADYGFGQRAQQPQQSSPPAASQPVKKEFNSGLNKTRVTYSDGSVQMMDGKQ